MSHTDTDGRTDGQTVDTFFTATAGSKWFWDRGGPVLALISDITGLQYLHHMSVGSDPDITGLQYLPQWWNVTKYFYFVTVLQYIFTYLYFT